MKTKHAVWIAFFLNLSYAIVEFIAGGIFGSSAVLADSVHDLGDAIAIGISAFLESISNREEDSHYTLGYKRFSLLGAMVTAVILMTGSVLVILENITKLFHPQPVNDEGILWLGIIAVSINVLASLVIRKGQTKNESILSLHFLEDTSGLGGCHPNGHCSPIYRLVYSGSALISCHFHLYSVKSHSTFLEHAQDFPGCRARRSRYPASQE